MAPTTGSPDAACVPSADISTCAVPGTASGAGSIAVIMDFLPMTAAEYDRLVEQLELSRAARGSSNAVFHWLKKYPDGIRVIEIWSARRPLTSFIETVLQPSLRDLGLSEPKLTFHDIPDYLDISGAPDASDQGTVEPMDPVLER
jgi:hypothetical protein